MTFWATLVVFLLGFAFGWKRGLEAAKDRKAARTYRLIQLRRVGYWTQRIGRN